MFDFNRDGLKFSLNLMCVIDVSAEVVLKNDSVRKLAELEGLQSLDLSGDSVTSTGQYGNNLVTVLERTVSKQLTVSEFQTSMYAREQDEDSPAESCKRSCIVPGARNIRKSKVFLASWIGAMGQNWKGQLKQLSYGSYQL
jgi:hypothetical protein